MSASVKKLKLSKHQYEIDVAEAFGYRFINFVAVMSAISKVVLCKKCKKDVTFTESAKRGLGF